MSTKPTVSELNTCLKCLVKWQQFPLYLPGIDQTDISIIEKDRRDDVAEQKRILYDKWLQVYPNASWDDVIKALETAEENTIAKQLREKYPTKLEEQQAIQSPSSSPALYSSAVSMSPNQTSVAAATLKEVAVPEEVVTELNTLHESFQRLAHDVESEVDENMRKGDLTVKSVTRHLKREQAFPIPSLDAVTTSDELFNAIQPHYNFLNCYLIISIALNFLSRAIAQKATKYKEKVGKFMKTTKIRFLQNTLKCYLRRFRQCPNTTVVEIVVESGWDSQNLWLVRNLVTTLFPVKHPDELPWYDLVPGSVVMTFIALKHMTPSLIESSRKKTEFMRLIGVISLKIGNQVIWEKAACAEDWDEVMRLSYSSFEHCLIRATLHDNIEAVQFLLQYSQVNVNARNTTNTEVVHYDYTSEGAVQEILESHYEIFTSLTEDIHKSLLDENAIESLHHPSNNFLNGRVLADLSHQLPEPLLRKAQHYGQSIDGSGKRIIPLQKIRKHLEKYFPTPFPDCIEVILTLHSVWRACSVWYVEQLGQLIFTPTLFHKLHWFRVDTSEESLRVVLLADKELMDSLAKECLANNESVTPLLGVISVRVDDAVVISNDYSNGYTFNEAMHLAKAIGNEEISSLLLQIHQAPVEYRDSSFSGFTCDDNKNSVLVLDIDSTPLMIACCGGNSQLVQLLLDHNADPNVQNGRGITALMYSTGNSIIFQMLKQHMITDSKKVTFFNETVLMFACIAGNTKVVKILLEENHELLNICDNNGVLPLMVASKFGHTAVVKQLLQVKADANMQDFKGWTALMETSEKGHTAVVEQLLQAKADPNIQANGGWTALMVASSKGHKAVVEQLLQAKANLSIQTNKYDLTALDIASQNNHAAVVQQLLQAKANPNNIQSDGWTALMNASAEGHTAVVEQLLLAKANPNTQDNNGQTALMKASGKGRAIIVKYLLQAKANPNIQGNDGRTALMEASDKGHTIIVQQLLQAKADPNIQIHKAGPWPSTALSKASRNGHTAVVKLLLQAKADPNIDNNEGLTALMHASDYGHTAVVKQLLEAKADPNLQAKNGWTALMHASATNRTAIIKQLLQAKADPNIQDCNGFTAMAVASSRRHSNAVKQIYEQSLIPVIPYRY